MISSKKIEEWIEEAEERPASATLIIRFIANRLSDVSARNEELLAENIELRSGRKVEDYESRIANLEYQVDLLKRQLGGEAIEFPAAGAPGKAVETLSLVVYNAQGQALRIELEPAALESRQVIATFPAEAVAGDSAPRLLLTGSQEELLFLFDSGRTATLPAGELPAQAAGSLDWEPAYLMEPGVGEELAAVLPVAKMSLFETCIQASRRGFIKKMKESAFESHLASRYVGSGVKLPADKTCGLTFCQKNDLFVMVSREGFLFSMEPERMPFTIEEALRLEPGDFILSAFALANKPSLLVITRSGKAIHREPTWLQPATSFRTRGQPAFSKERREAGVRVAGAAAVAGGDWGAALRSDGKLVVYQMEDLFASGALLASEEGPVEILGFTAGTV